MTSAQQVIERFIQEVGKEKPRFLRPASVNAKIGGSSRQSQDVDTVFSYGSHFPLAQLVGTRKDGFFLVNSDRYSSTTTSHQGFVRGAITRSGIKSILLPFSALDAAGIPHERIKPLQVESDRSEEEIVYVSNEELADVRTVTMTLRRKLQDGIEYPYSKDGWLFEWNDDGTVTPADEYEVAYRKLGDHTLFWHNGRWAYKRWRHWMGGSLFEAEYLIEPGHNTHPDMADYQRRLAALNNDDSKTWEERYNERTKMSEELTWVPDRFAKAKFLSSFDEQERRPLYFLCQLPDTDANTIEEAYESLKPHEVKVAEAEGLEVVRQGDIFAIPMAGINTKDIRTRSKRVSLLGTNHTATESFVSDMALPLNNNTLAKFAPRGTYARGTMYHDPEGRERDHARRKLGDGKTWHYIVKNTVPYATEPTQETERARFRSFDANSGTRTVRGWTMGGRVD